eukprot:CAMPEP_0204196772 /NCGR_PEP_ID=MMETSP0361-20130328/64074_1 /ASSEMBLY_ACC=CAM_ASM_000343 /TAXON_ID=268821 /ORGANISM="Scrippsiella Hangoei, Strain SHTV-5" /LENGTH=263 /DNA_ID=CAMNT_0051158579 /DNA_START=65 /DNA_END=854 /DNA_ORIENTATION=+
MAAGITTCNQDTAGVEDKQEQGVTGGLRGIGCMGKRPGDSSRTWYYANIAVDGLSIRSRYSGELATALEHLVLLTTLKQHIKASPLDRFETRVLEALSTIRDETSAATEECGLGFSVFVKVKWWWMPCQQFCTPVVHDIDKALSAWGQLHRFSSHTYGRVTVRERWRRFQGFEAEWAEFQAVFLDIAEGCGCSREQQEVRLRSRYEAAAPLRETEAMATEEAWHRQLDAREEQLQLWNTKAMEREERLMRRVQFWRQRRAARE